MVSTQPQTGESGDDATDMTEVGPVKLVISFVVVVVKWNKAVWSVPITKLGNLIGDDSAGTVSTLAIPPNLVFLA